MKLTKVGIGQGITATAPVEVKPEEQRVPADARVPNHRKNNSFGVLAWAE